MKRITTDVLVIGGGGAGLMAAYAASGRNVRVSIVNKGEIGRTGTTIMAPGAIAAVDERWKEAGDSQETHISDTLRGGAFLGDPDLVRLMVEKAPSLIIELENMGALFQRKPDGVHYELRIDGGHSHHRSPYIEDRAGKEMVRTMAGMLTARSIDVHEHVMITRLLTGDGRISGAVGFHTLTQEVVLFEAGAVILATGGCGSLYENTDNSIDMTGDGFLLALQAGAAVRDMEFVQFYPLGFVDPPSMKGILAGTCFYCHLLNSRHERLMERYDAGRLELSTRDRVSRAIVQEIRQGRGTPNGGVYMDLTWQEPGFIERMMPALYATYRSIGKDPQKDLFEVAPTAHFFMGGIDVDLTWSSRVPGLYAAGEVAGGMHGANRLSQNALAEVLVSGHVAGENAARFAGSHKPIRTSPAVTDELAAQLVSLRTKTGEITQGALRERLRRIMWTQVGVIRDEQSLLGALAEVEHLSGLSLAADDSAEFCNRSLLEAFEVRGLLMTARCVILAALERRESRGAHYREDYPTQDDGQFRISLIQSLSDQYITTTARPVRDNDGQNIDQPFRNPKDARLRHF